MSFTLTRGRLAVGFVLVVFMPPVVRPFAARGRTAPGVSHRFSLSRCAIVSLALFMSAPFRFARIALRGWLLCFSCRPDAAGRVAYGWRGRPSGAADNRAHNLGLCFGPTLRV
jgi:hypothetical protein